MALNIRKTEEELIKKKIIEDEYGLLPEGRLARLKRKFRELRERKPSVKKTTLDIVPYKGIIDAKNNFIINKNGFADVLLMQGYNLPGMSESAQMNLINSYNQLLCMYVYPFKNITIYTPIDTSEQQKYYKNLAARTTNKKLKRKLMETYFEMKYFSENDYNKEFYVIIYADTVEELRECRDDFIRYAGSISIHQIPYRRKKSLYFRLNNPSKTMVTG